MIALDRKKHIGGDIVRFEPRDLALINSDPTIRVAFDQMDCIKFCEKIQGYNAQLTKEFALNFIGVDVKVGELSFLVL